MKTFEFHIWIRGDKRYPLPLGRGTLEQGEAITDLFEGFWKLLQEGKTYREALESEGMDEKQAIKLRGWVNLCPSVEQAMEVWEGCEIVASKDGKPEFMLADVWEPLESKEQA
jgi:hypothetical protein